MSTREQLARDIRTECLEREAHRDAGHALVGAALRSRSFWRTSSSARRGDAYATYLSKSLWKPIGAADA